MNYQYHQYSETRPCTYPGFRLPACTIPRKGPSTYPGFNASIFVLHPGRHGVFLVFERPVEGRFKRVQAVGTDSRPSYAVPVNYKQNTLQYLKLKQNTPQRLKHTKFITETGR